MAGTQTAMGALLVTVQDRVPVGAFIAAAAVSGAASAATRPALHGIVVELVPPEARQAANAWQRLVVNLARVAVPGLGAVLAAAAVPPRCSPSATSACWAWRSGPEERKVER